MPAPVVIGLSDTHLRAERGGTTLLRRPVGDLTAISDATAKYATATKADHSERPIGRSLFDWLDGPDKWLKKLLDAGPSELWLEFVLDRAGNPAFLEAPWELLADDDDFLAGKPGLPFSVARRYAAASDPPAPSDYRPSVVFMAADPRGTTVALDYGAEEVAILQAIGVTDVDFLCEDSGNLPLLAKRIKKETEGAGVDIVHLSCHGKVLDGKPILAMEKEGGEPDEVGADAIAREFVGIRPRLLFLSACETAEPNKLLGSLAGLLVRERFPAVLGWAGGVNDVAATRFAAELYRQLAAREPLQAAVAAARRATFDDGDQHVKSEWHKARLFLGAEGGGPLCRGTGRRRHWHDSDRSEKEFLDKVNKRVPVATRRQFVGRRRPIQDVLRALRAPKPTVVYGLGQHGKSSLAARIASRFPSHDPVVVFGEYTPAAVLRAVSATLADEGHDGAAAARKIVSEHLAEVDGNPEAFRATLGRLLKGPFQELQTDKTTGKAKQRPILLILDDFERALADPLGGEDHAVKADLAPGIAEVLRAFANTEHNSHLLFTCRVKFTCVVGGRDAATRAEFVPLPDMTDSDLYRQAQQLALQLAEEIGKVGTRLTAAEVEGLKQSLVNVTPLVFGSPRLMSFAPTCGARAPPNWTASAGRPSSIAIRGRPATRSWWPNWNGSPSTGFSGCCRRTSGNCSGGRACSASRCRWRSWATCTRSTPLTRGRRRPPPPACAGWEC